jgi:hypothetical protein
VRLQSWYYQSEAKVQHADRRVTSYRIDGRRNPELFLPHELLDQLVSKRVNRYSGPWWPWAKTPLLDELIMEGRLWESLLEFVPTLGGIPVKLE